MKHHLSQFNPPQEFSVIPFWFWNDDLNADGIRRRIADFADHGVHGFVIHPRVGLPRRLGWMSEELLEFYDVAIEEAARRHMLVLLYDEAMYPSGSSCGQVVESNPDFQCRCLDKIELDSAAAAFALGEDETLVTVATRRDGRRLAIIDRKLESRIRGVHYLDNPPAEDRPLAADILNPAAVRCFVELVYRRFAERFTQHIPQTVLGVFTDEPSLLGKFHEPGVMPGTTGILDHVNRVLGYDFTPSLPALWFDDEPNAKRCRDDYLRACRLRLNETYYAQLSRACEEFGLSLVGHPHGGDEIGPLRYFQIPGQDIVWRDVLPDTDSALEGPQSTQAKCGSSAMLHHGRRRNANECCGAFGHELTWDEMTWIANWLLVRGVNMIIPHAFYYSVRGPRRDERPPDVGPNAPWWDRYKTYADACRLMSWLNADSTHVCKVAILGQADHLPWTAAKICFQHQIDFNYLEQRHLWEDAVVDDRGVQIRSMRYEALIIDETAVDQRTKPALDTLEANGRIVRHDRENPLATAAFLSERLDIRPLFQGYNPALRIREIRKNDRRFLFLFNEENAPLILNPSEAFPSSGALYAPWAKEELEIRPGQPIELPGHALKIAWA